MAWNDRDSSWPPIFNRGLSINTTSHLPNQRPFSPASLKSASPDASSVHQQHLSSSPLLGLGRLPEEEVASEGNGSAMGASPAFFGPPTAGLTRPLRLRSTSSAAALQGQDQHTRQPFDHLHHSSSLWRNHTPAQDLNYSSTFAHQQPLPSAFLSRQDQRLRLDHFEPPSFAVNSDVQSQWPNSMRQGSESRRHSMTAAPPVGERRAIGFEVHHPIGATAQQDVPVGGSGGGVRGGGYFGGGSLAIPDDDLLSEFDRLQINLDEVARQRNEAFKQSSQPAPAGAHAASVPTGFQSFGMSPPDRPALGNWPISARLAEDDKASIWSEKLPSPPLASSRRATDLPPPQGEQTNRTMLSARAQSFSLNNADEIPPIPHRQRATTTIGGHDALSRQADVNTDATASFAAQGKHTSRAPPSTLSEYAIAHLVTLGPLAPSSGPGVNEPPGPSGASNLQDLGKGVPLQMLPKDTPLYIVEFKQGRTDLYFRQSPSGSSTHDDIHKGDLVIVEADRGKDLGSVINDSITVDQVQAFLAKQAELAQLNAQGNVGSDVLHPAAVALSRLTRSVNPKRLFTKAGPADTSLLHAKTQDEERALTLCTTKVNQRGLPMAVVAAEMQWDRRKLTFYYTATQRVDFRDLVKELFRLYKTRIWMCHLSHPGNGGGNGVN